MITNSLPPSPITDVEKENRMITALNQSVTHGPQDKNTQALKEASIKLEATFLSEMLKSAGVGESRGDFGGGAGEEQFGSFLRDAQALELARSGGIGLAESIFEAMKARANE